MAQVFVHGGVSGVRKAIPDIAACARTGASTALDAVVEAVMALEDHPELNAGFGACLTQSGTIELDAGIAHGPAGRAAGVANVSVRHPIVLARRVLEKTPHVLVAGDGAMALGPDLEVLERTTDEQHDRWEKARAGGELGIENFAAADKVDTVGAVCLGDDGALSCGSSTGGVFGKLPGRIGDSPIFGAGIYASPAATAVGTGVGELFLETLAAAHAGRLIEDGAHPQDACERVIASLATRSKAAAGLLALDATGRHGAAYRGGSWAVAGPDGAIEARRVD